MPGFWASLFRRAPAPIPDDMHLVVGLGNPGRSYRTHRHNVGFMVIDQIAEREHVSLNTKSFKGLTARTRLGGESVVLLQPQTFMNLSGDCVGPVAGYFRIPVEDVIVVHDDLDLPFGHLRVKSGGGAGGHNGLKSIGQHLGQGYARVRVGIGRPRGEDFDSPAASPKGERVVGHVLSAFSQDELRQLGTLLDDATAAVEHILRDGVKSAMNAINKRVKPDA